MMYDPASQALSLAFQAQPCLYVNGAFSSVAGDYEFLSIDLSSIASTCYGQGTDPVTGADLTKISGAGALAIVKLAYAAIWDAQVAAEAAAAAAAAAQANSTAAAQEPVAAQAPAAPSGAASVV